MNVDIIFKIAGLGIVVGILHTVLEKSGKEEFGFIVTIAGIVIVFGVVVNLIAKLFDNVKVLFRL